MRWFLQITFSVALLSLSVTAYATNTEETPDLEDATVCGSETNDCRKVSCMEMCVQGGEDPMECPSYCILEARDLSPNDRYDLHSAFLKTQSSLACK